MEFQERDSWRGKGSSAVRKMSHQLMADPPTRQGGASLARVSPYSPVETITHVKPRDPAGEAVVHALRAALSRIGTHEPEAKRGESEGVHRLRSASRRLRSELRALKDLLVPRWQEQLEVELKWLAGLLGDVRDLDILLARLHEASLKFERPDIELPALSPLLQGLEGRRGRAARVVSDALESQRYRGLLATLERAAEHPPLEESAGEACRVALPPAAMAAWHRLRKAARELSPDDPDEEFHEARKRAKSARYTAELIAPLLGRRAARDSSEFIRLTARVQDTLGEHQDALITMGELAGALSDHADDSDLVERAGALLEEQRQRARAARARFFKIWARLDRKKLRRWMKPRLTASSATVRKKTSHI
jgi:CHAD domain-containing protein